MLTTQVASACAALGWMFVEWIAKGKPSALGIASGAVAGLVAITPASGFVGVGGSIAIGFIAGAVCFWSATWLKMKLGYDDSLDCFGVHGVGGIIGALLTGVFAVKDIGGFDGQFHLLQSRLCNNVRRLFPARQADATGINEREFVPAPLSFGADAVARHARLVMYNRNPPPNNPIEQGRLPDIWPSHYRYQTRHVLRVAHVRPG